MSEKMEKEKKYFFNYTTSKSCGSCIFGFSKYDSDGVDSCPYQNEEIDNWMVCDKYQSESDLETLRKVYEEELKKNG